MNPIARTENLIVSHVDDEVVLYDEITTTAHRLNPSAAAVWFRADGSASVEELAAAQAEATGGEPDVELVRVALDELDQAGLMNRAPDASDAVSRRAALRRVAAGVGLAVGLPLVTSLVAPTPAMAQSCVPQGSVPEPGPFDPPINFCTTGGGSSQ